MSLRDLHNRLDRLERDQPRERLHPGPHDRGVTPARDLAILVAVQATDPLPPLDHTGGLYVPMSGGRRGMVGHSGGLRG